jgi:hypothetical protein
MVLMSRRIAALAGILILYWISSAPYERSSIMFAHSQDSIAFIAPCAQQVNLRGLAAAMETAATQMSVGVYC